MSTSYHQLYVQFVWTTFNRTPLLSRPHRLVLGAYLHARALALDSNLLAFGGVEDHVHALVRLHSSVDVARMARELKAPSSGYIRRRFRWPHFSWQDGYGAFTVRRDDVEAVTHYLRNQEQHHRTGELIAEFETSAPHEPD